MRLGPTGRGRSAEAGTRVVTGAIRLYQAARLGRPSPCRFTPSCSSYALEAVERHGPLRGLALALARLGRCRPFGGSGFDPVPERLGARGRLRGRLRWVPASVASGVMLAGVLAAPAVRAASRGSPHHAAPASGGLGQILNPIFQAIAGLLAFFYDAVPNYAIAIALVTLTIMVVLAPLTIKSTRSMLAMQRLQPEIKKIQQKFKGDRQAQQEALSELFRQHNVSPAGGCLPMLLQLPVFWVLYSVIRGLTNTVRVGGKLVPSPKYISHTSHLYHDLVSQHGTMYAFGIDLARSATSIHGNFGAALPYWLLVALAIGLQYLQMRQLTSRNPQAAQANPQAQTMQRVMPIVFGVIYIAFPAGVTVYFLVSSLVRIAQQELMYRFDPVVKASIAPSGTVETTATPVEGPVRPKGAASGRATGLRGLLGPRDKAGRAGVARAASVGDAQDGRGSPSSPRGQALSAQASHRGSGMDGAGGARATSSGDGASRQSSSGRSHARSRKRKARRGR